VARLAGLPLGDLRVICNEEHRFMAAEQLRVAGGLNKAHILLEPVGRNTAPAIALAALHALQANPNALLLVLAADHLIQNTAAFQAAVRQAMPMAQQGKLVTFGVVPTHPETGYGYLQRGEPLGVGGYQVARFVEKPDAPTAQAYLSSGQYFWNSGMFLFGAQRYLDELQRWQPAMLEACRQALNGARADMDFLRLDAEAFSRCPADSVDYAVMEKTADAAMVPLDAGWSDVGSWSSLWEVSPKDAQGNVFKGDVLAHDTHGTYVHADSRLVATVGLTDLVVVETKDAVLVARKDQVQDVKKVVEALKAQGRPEYLNHREVYRPWGMYDSVDQGERYQVKRITVKAGARLSLQMHHHRAEHWIVVSGTAKVTKGQDTFLVTENESTFIPVGEVHSLENPGVIPLELIEVQSGSYLGEDDIVRLKDQYGRV
jgi:mannose-1-phosphate guanylyltransferase